MTLQSHPADPLIALPTVSPFVAAHIADDLRRALLSGKLTASSLERMADAWATGACCCGECPGCDKGEADAMECPCESVGYSNGSDVKGCCDGSDGNGGDDDNDTPAGPAGNGNGPAAHASTPSQPAEPARVGATETG